MSFGAPFDCGAKDFLWLALLLESSCHPADLIVTLLTFVVRNAPGGNSLLIVVLNPL